MFSCPNCDHEFDSARCPQCGFIHFANPALVDDDFFDSFLPDVKKEGLDIIPLELIDELPIEWVKDFLLEFDDEPQPIPEPEPPEPFRKRLAAFCGRPESEVMVHDNWTSNMPYRLFGRVGPFTGPRFSEIRLILDRIAKLLAAPLPKRWWQRCSLRFRRAKSNGE